MTRTLWFQFPAGASTWSVFLADPGDPGLAPENDVDSPDEGATFYETSTILINRKLPRARRADVLVHELLHAAMHVSGTKHSLRLSTHREEQIILGIAPMLAHALVGSRLLRMPRAPKDNA